MTRVTTGIVFASLVFMTCVFLPSHIGKIMSLFTPGVNGSVLRTLMTLVNPTLPLAGIFLVVLTFLEVLVRNTKIYGPILIFMGVGFVSYIYLVFWGGIIRLTLPTEMTMGLSVNLAVDLTVLMLLLMAPPILTAAKGILLTFGKT